MFKEWLISDIEKAARKSNRVVISDPSRFLTFMVKELTGYSILTLNTNQEEMEARRAAQTVHAGSKVIFLCFFPSKDITQLIEFAGIGGFINYDNPEGCIRDRLFKELHQNVTIPEKKLLLSAKLSKDKNLKWWEGIVNETIEPLDLREHLHDLILNPKEYQEHHDEDVYEVVKEEMFKLIGRPAIPMKAETLLSEFAATIFSGLVNNNISRPLREYYYWWTNSSDLLPSLRNQAGNWTVPGSASPLMAHPDHPFPTLDRKLLSEIGARLRNNSSLVEVTEAIRKRTKSQRALAFKPQWLKDLLVLLDFDSSEMYLYDTLQKLTKYYKDHFAILDTAMRHLYSEWIGEPQLIRPLQEQYESHLKSLLSAWFNAVPSVYKPTQEGLIAAALNSDAKVAVLVCDGLRLEIAETVAKASGSPEKIERRIEYAKLPSVTENGMSALFDLDHVAGLTAPRFQKLKEDVPRVEIIQYLNLSENIHCDKLVVMYGDIDTVGEHKGLSGLRDINNYEKELVEAIKQLHRLGFKEVYLTADHGFVITGLLDEASKVPAPAGVDVKERFFLCDDFINETAFIRREDNFPGGKYQYYSKTDRPFRTRGAYGYAHGGFTPQEVIIPMYCFPSNSTSNSISVKIANRSELGAVTGQFFTVLLKGDEASAGERIKVLLYSGTEFIASTMVKLDSNGEGNAEFEMSHDNMSVVLQSVTTGAQLDNANIRKSFSRDLGDL